MGREVKRVHLDFDWFETQKEKNMDGTSPWSKTWKGFILPSIKCFLCNGTGKNSRGKEYPLCYGDGKVTPNVEPPKSYDENGFQIWQDVSEGSPISPVFKKAEDLAKWMTENDHSTSSGTSYKAWLKMIKENGSAPSMFMDNTGIHSGTELYEEKK